jgi:hypothetical protein
VTTDVPHDEHERYAGRTAPDHAGPPGQELSSAGTDELNQIAASATLPPPDTIAGWKAVADGLLSDPCCAFHRNVEISSRYAWIYQFQPACFKWAAMAAIASHHIRLALFPLRLDTDRTGYVDIPHSLVRRKLLLTEDVNTVSR